MKLSQEEIAKTIAIKAHEGQFDKAGVPYIEHPKHVSLMVDGDDTKAVAWLHDVIEDTDVTIQDLRDAGINETVIEAVSLMTHLDGVPYLDYILAIKENDLARIVKLADLAHNSDLGRIKSPTEEDCRRLEKYRAAIDILTN